MNTNSDIFVLFKQEQLRRRREEEERIAAQNDFLRNSLRGSQRLRALQDNPVAADKPAIGVDNEAYADDEEPEKIIGRIGTWTSRFFLGI